MNSTIKMEIQIDEIIRAVQQMDEEKRDAFIEDLLAVTSPEYLNSIREARSDYKAGRISDHKSVFGDDVYYCLKSCSP